jgi:hypothetical protein
MGLRSDFAADLASFVSESDGLGESLTYTAPSAQPVTIRGVWSDGVDTPDMVGAGMERLRRTARLVIPLSVLATINRAAVITRTATGEAWVITEAPALADGVSWSLELAQRQPARARGAA